MKTLKFVDVHLLYLPYVVSTNVEVDIICMYVCLFVCLID